MISNIILDGVEARMLSRKAPSEFHTSVDIGDAYVAGGHVVVCFLWGVTYGDGLGYLKMDGKAYAREGAKDAAKIISHWKKTKRLPAKFERIAILAINYFCTLNSAFLAKPVNAVPPINVSVPIVGKPRN